jgi:hypothetical protein
MRYFLVEAELPAQNPSSGLNYKTFHVKDKTFEAACERLSHKIGLQAKYKLIAIFEPSELDKNIQLRVA